jgi:isopenicillin-N epimerase
MLEPLVVSWGWEADEPGPSRFVDHHQVQGTRDIAAFLSVPAAIEFQREHNWPNIRNRCHELALLLRQQLLELFGTAELTPGGSNWFVQMFSVQLPDVDPHDLQKMLLVDHNIEVVGSYWNQLPLLRVSIQAYNDDSDGEALIQALQTCLPSDT